jgi:hypothetical protein
MEERCAVGALVWTGQDENENEMPTKGETTYEDEVMTSSRMRSNCAMTHRTLRCTPKARRKSQSRSTWSSGGVQAQSVRIAKCWWSETPVGRQ